MISIDGALPDATIYSLGGPLFSASHHRKHRSNAYELNLEMSVGWTSSG